MSTYFPHVSSKISNLNHAVLSIPTIFHQPPTNFSASHQPMINHHVFRGWFRSSEGVIFWVGQLLFFPCHHHMFFPPRLGWQWIPQFGGLIFFFSASTGQLFYVSLYPPRSYASQSQFPSQQIFPQVPCKLMRPPLCFN